MLPVTAWPCCCSCIETLLLSAPKKPPFHDPVTFTGGPLYGAGVLLDAQPAASSRTRPITIGENVFICLLLLSRDARRPDGAPAGTRAGLRSRSEHGGGTSRHQTNVLCPVSIRPPTGRLRDPAGGASMRRPADESSPTTRSGHANAHRQRLGRGLRGRRSSGLRA